ncbi:hypothetical protein EDC96DRAFT_555738 [Choanephora cucurbitarum]|nr:hypothetical protein EDC96DRAFT_555738 [Choanephora cucurbitarum]
MCMPLQVVAHPNGTQTLCFDHALPRQTVNARERNRLVFSVSFKSYITDINKKHSIIPSETVNEEEDEENLHYNLWTFGDLNILIRYQSDAELHDKEKQKPERVLLDTKVNYFDGELREIITPVERASNWFRSYIHGHANIIQGHINVPKHQVNSIETKTMSDIMSGDWQPHYETGVLLHLFTNLHR